MYFQKVYSVTYLCKKDSLDSCYRLVFLQNINSVPYEQRTKYFLKEREARRFLNVSQRWFRMCLPEYRYLITKSNFKIRTRIRLVRETEK